MVTKKKKKPTLANTVSGISRKPTTRSKHMTLDGTIILTKVVCKICKKPVLLREGYLKSHKQRKHENDIRPYHADCYIATNGKIKQKSESKPAISFGVEHPDAPPFVKKRKIKIKNVSKATVFDYLKD
jgi:hypothetical protein